MTFLVLKYEHTYHEFRITFDQFSLNQLFKLLPAFVEESLCPSNPLKKDALNSIEIQRVRETIVDYMINFPPETSWFLIVGASSEGGLRRPLAGYKSQWG